MDFDARGRTFEKTGSEWKRRLVSKLFIILSVRKYPAASGFTTAQKGC